MTALLNPDPKISVCLPPKDTSPVAWSPEVVRNLEKFFVVRKINDREEPCLVFVNPELTNLPKEINYVQLDLPYEFAYFTTSDMAWLLNGIEKGAYVPMDADITLDTMSTMEVCVENEH